MIELVNLNAFMHVYTKNLDLCVRTYPEIYNYPPNSVPHVALRMRDSIVKRSFNKDSKAFKLTCKELGIKHTYTDIYKFLTGSME